MRNSFTAIDFETAVGKRNSICQIGLVRYENRILTNEINLLVQPPNNEYFPRNIEIHGITPAQTRNSPTFNKVWHQIEPFIKNQTVVAHNGAFDFSCLKQTLEFYNMEQPEYIKECTYNIFGQDLASLCRQFKIKLNHHDALSDARACAELYLIYLAAKY